MAEAQRVARPAFPTPVTSPSEGEDARAFFQARLSMFGLAVLAMSGGFYGITGVIHVVMTGTLGDGKAGPNSPASLWHLGANVVAAVLWLATRRRRIDAHHLPWIDAIATSALCACFACSGALLSEPMAAVLVVVLPCLCTLVTRGIVVPSTPRRTLVVSIGGSVTMLLALPVIYLSAGRPTAELALQAVYTSLWGAIATTIATIATRTIFGLRREAGQARRLGQYTLQEKIGEGGMGEVWRAGHAMLRRPTAIKLLPAARAGDAALRRFEREVQLTASLTHPNIIAVYDFGRTADGVFYYAMEYLDGVDLERLVETDGPMPPERVVHVLRQVCGALAEAHSVGLVHRDVKPANVLLAPRGEHGDLAKVVDFGLVKDLDRTGTETSLTGMNTLTGTPLYLSPEAIRAADTVDARSDLYALGAVAFFLLTGRPPFESRTILEVCGHHLHTEPRRPSDVLGRALPAELEGLVLRCLAKDPASRPASARALRDALDATGLRSAWTAERASEWWTKWRGRPAQAHREAVGTARTVAVDVAQRVGHA